MRLRTQLFLGTALLAGVLMSAQALIQQRQLQALEGEITRMAEGVGAALFSPESQSQVKGLFLEQGATLPSAAGGLALDPEDPAVKAALARAGVSPEALAQMQGVLEIPEPAGLSWTSRRTQTARTIETQDAREDGAGAVAPPPGSASATHRQVHTVILRSEALGGSDPDGAQGEEPRVREGLRVGEEPRVGEELRVREETRVTEAIEVERDPEEAPRDAVAGLQEVNVEIVVLQGSGGEGGPQRTLIIKGPDGEASVALPPSQAEAIIRSSLVGSLLTSGSLLLLGLLAAALFADRVSRPLRALAEGAESLGQGALGAQVPVTGSGEVADLQRAFNQMSQRLADLEAEKARWQARAHLAELGDVARGLGHSLRNPLNTLGLAVEELAEGAPERQELVGTVRAQIARIDRWLRGFLALGAGKAATAEDVDLWEILEELALEGGGGIVLGPEGPPVVVRAVRPALKAALSNLATNALEVSPADRPVEVRLTQAGSAAEITLSDRGPGLPEAVRARLFSPHVTTRPEGSGMGLFLARQLIEGGHGGALTLTDRPGGGTVATVTIPRSGGAP